MGIAKTNIIDGALYGFKGEIKEELREGRVPKWMHPESPGVYGGEGDPMNIEPDTQSPRTFLKRVKKHANKKDGFIAKFEIHGRKSNRTNRRFSATTSKTRPPERIREKLESYLDGEHQNVLDWLRDGEFYRGLRVVVTFGPRGGVTEMQVEAEYGN